MTNEKFHNLFGQKPRNPAKEKITQFQGYCCVYSKSNGRYHGKIIKIFKNEFKIENLRSRCTELCFNGILQKKNFKKYMDTTHLGCWRVVRSCWLSGI